MILTQIKEPRPLIITNKILSTLKQLSKIKGHGNNVANVYLCSGTIMAKSVSNTIFAETTFKVFFDGELGILDLPAFIKQCHNGSEIYRDGEDIVIVNGASEARLPHTPEEKLALPRYSLEMPAGCTPYLPFFINKATIKAIKKLNKTSYPNVHFINDGKSITIKASSHDHHEQNEAAQSVVITKAELPTHTDRCYKIVVPIENLNFLDSREQEIGFYTKDDEVMAAFTVKNPDIEFIISIKSGSTLMDEVTT